MTDETVRDVFWYREQQELYNKTEWNTRKLRDQIEVLSKRNHELYKRLVDAETERNFYESSFNTYKRDWIDLEHALKLVVMKFGEKQQEYPNKATDIKLKLENKSISGLLRVGRPDEGNLSIYLDGGLINDRDQQSD